MAAIKPKHSSDIWGYLPDLLDADPDNNRDVTSEAALAAIDAEITEPLIERGFDAGQELLVRPIGGGRAMVTDGHRRLVGVRRAIERGALLETIPCRHEPPGFDAAKRALVRLRPHGLERSASEAVADIQKLIGWQWDVARIAKSLGRPRSWVEDTLTIASAPEPIIQAVAAGTVAKTTAARLVRSNDGPVAAVAALDAAREHATARRSKVVRPRDVAAVTKARTEPVSICTLAQAVVREWRIGYGAEFDAAMNALAERFPELRATA